MTADPLLYSEYLEIDRCCFYDVIMDSTWSRPKTYGERWGLSRLSGSSFDSIQAEVVLGPGWRWWVVCSHLWLKGIYSIEVVLWDGRLPFDSNFLQIIPLWMVISTLFRVHLSALYNLKSSSFCTSKYRIGQNWFHILSVEA